MQAEGDYPSGDVRPRSDTATTRDDLGVGGQDGPRLQLAELGVVPMPTRIEERLAEAEATARWVSLLLFRRTKSVDGSIDSEETGARRCPVIDAVGGGDDRNTAGEAADRITEHLLLDDRILRAKHIPFTGYG